jgi:hypothetical protein
MRPAKTHFEQIPVEVVKKIATEFPEKNSSENESPRPQTPDKTTPGGGDWRELAQKVQEETDNKKMMGMVEELIAKLDEADLRKRRLLTRDNQGGSDSSET